MKAALKYFFVFLACQIVAGGVAAGIMGLLGNSDSVESLILSSAIASIATLAIFVGAKWCNLTPDYIKQKPYNVLLLAGLTAVSTLVPSAFFQEMLPEAWVVDLMEGTFEEILSRPEGYILVAIFAPLVEEIVFRGAILKILLEKTKDNPRFAGERSVRISIALSALFFAAAHMNPAQVPHAFVLGLLLGWMYYRTGSVLPGIVFHWVNNTVAFLLGYLLPEIPYDAKLVDYFGGSYEYVLVAVAVSFLVLVPCILVLNVLMQRGGKQDYVTNYNKSEN